MPSRGLQRCGLAVAALAVLVAAAVRCFGTDVRELAVSLQDDSFYYLLSAYRAWQHGGVLTFDGEHAMFGVQPAYAAWLALLAGPCPDRETFLRVALLSSYCLYVWTAFVLGRVARRLVADEVAGNLASIAWLANMPVLFGFTTLKENVLYALLLALAIDRAVATTPRVGRLGFLLGLGLATRLTPSSVLLAAVLAAVALRGRWRASGWLGLGGVLGLAPFVGYGLAIVGRALPTSGSVKTLALQQALADGSYWQDLPTYLAEVPGYLSACLRYSLGLPHGWFHVPQSPPPPHAIGYVLAALAGLGLLTFALPGPRRRYARLLALLFVADALGTAATNLLLRPFGQVGYFQWYVAATPVLVATVVGAGACGLRALRGPAVVALAAAAVAQAVVVVAARPPFRAEERSWTRQMLLTTARMNDLLPPGARVGSANAGGIGYFARADLAVVNLDGLANDDYYDAMRAGMSLREYLDSRRVDYVCDVLTAGGFGRHALADGEPLEVTPFRGPEYDGHFLLRRVDVPFPEAWPLDGGRGAADPGVVCVPWHEGDAITAAAGPSPLRTLASGRRGMWASWRFDRGTRGDGPVFLPGGTMARLQACVGGCDGTLVVLADGGERLRLPTTARRWSPLDLAVDDVARLDLDFEPASPAAGALWLAGLTWSPAGPPPANTTSGCFPFGHGCASGGQVPRLSGRLDTTGAALVVSGDARTAGMLVVSRAALPTRLSPRREREPCMSWLDGDQLVATLPFVTGDDGRVTVELPLAAGVGAPGRLFAQALLGQGQATRFSNGLRLQR